MAALRKWISNLITGVLFITLLFMLFVVISSKASGGEPAFNGYQLKTVLSGSMEPGIQTGSIIAVKPGGDMTRFQKGDVITFKASENKLITHRIYKVEGKGDNVRYITKGDNNNAPDPEPVLSANVVAQYNGFTIPYIGYGMEFAQSKKGTMLLMIVPGILLLIYSAITIWRALREIEISKKESTL
ncbi:signal peptidase, endoplasmic reticulum-type [Fictibacillus solisalsi]|uniref:Signal peptidase I n=1 Tax=Fictibacillus solisalsi TaxID=459525 RepID=A0A1G9XDJ2_9BACL|nr:signal peptidase I [Fictibacillus solisalsi]SDM94757.1 signal peptidase, endoplasmic reticulum-type [Fictibacillus solisalsi]